MYFCTRKSSKLSGKNLAVALSVTACLWKQIRVSVSVCTFLPVKQKNCVVKPGSRSASLHPSPSAGRFCVSICIFVRVKQVNCFWKQIRVSAPTSLCRQILRQYLYFCTSKASKLLLEADSRLCTLLPLQYRQLLRRYLHFCTSKASKLSTSSLWPVAQERS